MIAFFLFYNQSSGVQAKLAFSKEFRHCNIITYDGAHWVNYELDHYGIHTRVLKVKDGASLIRGLKTIPSLIAIVSVFINERKKLPWKPWWVRSCNEFDRYISAVDIGFTWNPLDFHRKLLKYDLVRNYEILVAWRRHGKRSKRDRKCSWWSIWRRWKSRQRSRPSESVSTGTNQSEQC